MQLEKEFLKELNTGLDKMLNCLSSGDSHLASYNIGIMASTIFCRIQHLEDKEEKELKGKIPC